MVKRRRITHVLSSADIAPLVLGYCGSALDATRLQTALGRRGSRSLRRVLLSGVMNRLLAARRAGCSQRGLSLLSRWSSRSEGHRARLVSWLLQGLSGHGLARVGPAWIEAEESVALVSLPCFATDEEGAPSVEWSMPARAEDRRVVFAVSESNRNLCNTGCWCTGKVTHAVCCFVPSAKRTSLTPLVALTSLYGHGAHLPPNVWRPLPGACDKVARLLGIDRDDLGLVVKFVFVAAGGENGSHRWNSIEQAHVNPNEENAEADDLSSDASISFADFVADSHILCDLDDDEASLLFFDESDDDTDSDTSDVDSDSDDDDDDESVSCDDEADCAVRDFPFLNGADHTSKAVLLHSWDTDGITPRKLLQRTADLLQTTLPDRLSSDLTRLSAALANWSTLVENQLEDDDRVVDALCGQPSGDWGTHKWEPNRHTRLRTRLRDRTMPTVST